MPDVRKARDEDLKDGKISQAEYDKIESMERNHISNISTAHSNIGYLLTLVINLSVLLPLQGNPFGNNLALCLTNSCKLSCQLSRCAISITQVGRSIVVFKEFQTIQAGSAIHNASNVKSPKPTDANANCNEKTGWSQGSGGLFSNNPDRVQRCQKVAMS
jgi:hypothetical protein